jgi:hypothetical protein
MKTQAMRTYYLLDLGLYEPLDFAYKAVEIKAASEAHAVREWAVKACDDLDGRATQCMVANHPSGEEALAFKVRQRIEIFYDLEECAP